MHIGVILASIREGRRGEAFAKWITALLAARPEARTELLDLREWTLPSYTSASNATAAEQEFTPGTIEHRWLERIRSLDGFIFVSPEYNRGYPGHLKNAIDLLYTAWNYKPAAFVSYGGSANGALAAQQLVTVTAELRMVPVRDQVNIRLIGLDTTPEGWPAGEFYAKRAATMLNELLWWTGVLKEARSKRTSH